MDKMIKNSNLFKMSIPIFVELLLQLFVGNVDQVMVGWSSKTSVAAIVNGNQIINLMITTMNMLCMATTIMLTQYLGAKEKEKANQICVLTTAIMAGIGMIMTVISIFFGQFIFKMMQIDPIIMDETCLYLMIVGGVSVFQALHMNFVAILRSYTRLKEVMGVSIVMNLLNVIGNTLLINGLCGFPKMGVVGAAIATALSKIVGLIIMCILLVKYTEIDFKLKYLFDNSRDMVKHFMKIGLPTGAENFSYQLSQAFILGIINPYGAIVTATKGYCSILANVSYIYGIAIAQALQIVIGYLLGSGKIDEVEKKVWWTTKIGILTSSGIMFLLWLFSDQTLGIFTNDMSMLALGKQILFIDMFLEAGRAINTTLTKSFISVGEIRLPIMVGISFQWIVGFGLSYIFSGIFHMGLSGVWFAMMLDECIRGIIYVTTFRKKKWKQRYKVEKEMPLASHF